MYRITKNGSICYCECEIQDGTERWEEKDLKTAIYSVIKAARVLNNVYIREDDIKIADLSEKRIGDEVKINISDEDYRLLQEIESGEKVVLNFDDKRIKYRLTDEECDLIVRMREGMAP